MTDTGMALQPPPSADDGSRSNGYWGMAGLVAAEAALFAYLLFAYYYDAVQLHQAGWRPEGGPALRYAIPQTIVLLSSSAVMALAERSARSGVGSRQRAGLAAAFFLGAAFIALQALEWTAKKFTLSSGAYGSLFFTIGGFHLAHLIVGMLILAAVLTWSLLGYFGPGRTAPVSIAALYWHFVVALWLAVFFTLYVIPQLGPLWRTTQP